MFGERRFIFRRGRKKSHWVRVAAAAGVFFASIAVASCGGSSVFPSGVSGGDGGSNGGSGSGSGGGGGGIPPAFSPCDSPLYEGCEKGSGEAADPYRIYNIYHLQAMGGGLPNGVFPALALLFPATEESLRAGVATLFGEAEARTAAHYRLENDIDATQTGQTNWHEGEGFLPIGDSASPFLGALDGAGYAIRGLQMRRAGEMAGFFGVVGASGQISNLGVDGGEVEGDSMVGLLAARVEAGGVIEGAWGRGRVRGSDNVGGLVGYLADGAMMRRSWFGGHVRGRRNVGGLVGGAESRSVLEDTIANSWAMAQTHGFAGVGGLAGNWESGNRMTASWAGGPLTGTGSRDRFGCLASGLGESSASYSGVETSGCSVAGIGGMAVDSLQTLVAPEWSGAVWDFGSDSDFPVLRNIATSDGRGRSLQAGGIIFGLTRLLRGDGTAFPSLPLDLTTSAPGEEQSMLRLDVNGLAADDGSATARLSSCRISGGAISAASNYNGARVSMFLLSSFGARLSLEDEDLCVVGIDSGAGGLATLRLSYAGAGSGSEDVLHLDYAAQLSPGLTPPSPPPPPIPPPPPPSPLSFGFAETPTGFYPVMVFSGATAGESVLTVTVLNGSLVSFAGGGFASGGGSEAALSLTESAVDLFTIDGLELSLTLEARGGEGQSATVTTRFVSSALPFNGSVLSVTLSLSEAQAGAEIFAAEEVGLTIWHNEDEDERYELTQEIELFGVDEGTGRMTASSDVSSGTYNFTLQLTDGETTAERALRLEVLSPALAIVSSSALSSGRVTVSSDAGSGHAALTVTLRGGTNAAFASSSAPGLTATGGGVEAVVSLTASAIELFTVDGLELSLALTASDADESSTVTLRFASSARGFDGAALSELIRTTALGSGTEVFAAADANLTIWHNNNDDEEYTLEGVGSELFTAGSDGAVSSSSELDVGAGARYDLTLVLRDGEVSARRRLELQLSPPVLSALAGVTATVAWDAGSGTAALSLTLELETGATFAATIANGLETAGGREATILLANDAVNLFTADGLELTLTLAASNGGGTVFLTARFESSSRPFAGGLAESMLPLSEAITGAEIFAAEEVGLTIWHNEDEDERYELTQDVELFGVDEGTGRVTALLDAPSGTYNFTLQLTDGETTAERPLRLEVLPPALAIVSSAALSSGRVTVSSDAGSGHSALTVTLRGGTNAAFLSSSAPGLTATGSGVEAVVSLTASAIELFTLDGLELSLALTASDADESSTVTVRFASSARGFDGAALSELIQTTALQSGTEVFAAADANLTIWHNNNDDEEYSLEGDGSELFTAGSDGAVRAAGELEVGSGKSYALTLILRDGDEGGVSARRRLELQLSPPALSALSGVTATVEWDAGSGTAALSLTLELETGATFAATTANGLETAGGREATILLANDAVNLFTADGLELTLTLAASNGGGTVFLTARFESSSRLFAGGLAESMLPLSEAIAGVEIFAAEEVNLTIWHNNNDGERYTLSQAGNDFGVDVATGLVTAAIDVSAGTYNFTLQLTDGETTAERPLRLEVLSPALAIVSSSALSSGRVTVSSDAGSGHSALTVTLRGGTNAAFASSSASGLTATGGGVEAVVSLTASAIELFTLDGLELSLALTASDADESSTVTLRFVSTPRGFDGAALSELIRTTALPSGTEVFAAADANLTIWHNNDGDEEYSLEGDGSELFTAGSDGAVRSAGELEVGSGKSYVLTLILRDGEASARRRLELELSPPVLSALDGVTATVAWDAGSGTAALSLTLELETGATFAATIANGLETAGGREATILLANDAVNLFTADGLELTLTLAASNGGGTVFLTARFESSSRPFAGGLAESMLPLSEALAGAEIFAAEEVGLTIWHNEDEDERYELTQEVELFGVDEGTGRVTASLEVSAGTYNFTLQLTDGETTAERPLRLEVLPPALAIVSSAALSSDPVTVLSDAGSGYAALTVTLRGGTNAAFLSSSSRGLTATGGGEEAVVSLTASAIELFTVDGLELSLALTASDADESSTVTVRFVSSARGFDGAALSELIRTTRLPSGTEVFAAADANLTIWHNDDGDEEYTLEGDGSDLFTAGSDGAVRSAGELEVGSGKSYALTLILRDGEASARRRLELELSPPVLSALDGVTATVEWDAGSGTAALSLTLELETGATFAATIANGLETAGGREATILLANDAVNLFTADGLELTLTLAASNGGGTVFLTARFESSSRPFAGGLAEAMLPLSEAIAGAEIFMAEEVGLTIWHNEDEDERYELTQEIELFGVDEGTGRVTASLEVSAGTYNFTLQLTDGETTAERPLRLEVLPPALAIVSSAALSSDPVTVLSDAGSGYAALTVTLRGGTNAAFASSSAPGLTATGGGDEAVVSLTARAIELFTVDGLELSLALTASDADESSTVTVRFVSSARGFDGAALRELIQTTALQSGTEVFAASDANLTIWHNNDGDEEYTLEGDGSDLFTAGSDGAVRSAGELEVGSGKSYALTLILRDGEASARRRLELQLSPPVLSALDGVTATVEWDAGSGTAALSLTLELETGATFAATIANGLETAGGREATILLANDAVNLFTADGLELTLTLAASNGGGTVFLTATFESSSRPFAGGLAESRLPLSEAITGAEIFMAEEVKLTIWHNEDEDERYELTQEIELFGVDEGTGRVTALLEVSAGTYNFTLQLTDGETTAERALRLEVLPPALAIVSSSALSSDPVTVLSDAGSGYAALTVTLRGGTNAAFASSSAPGLTATGGGDEAVVSLTARAIELFTEDGLELSLALTASDADESSTVTVRFASSARGFDGAALSELIRTTALQSGTEVFAAADANLTIWHNNNDDEEYSLEGDGSELFTAGSDGAVRSASELEVGSGKSYALTLVLRDGEASARRRLELELSPPVLSALDGVTATVEWDAGSGTAALSLTLELETGATFAATIANGLETAGGREATILLANDAVNLFTADGLELTLTLAASNGGGTVFLTATFESSSRPFAGGLAESMLPLSEAQAGAEIFTAEEVSLTIWHNEDEDERYELTQEVELFGVDEGTGRVTASLEVSAGTYNFTLQLTDGETTAERPLRLEVLSPALAIVSSAALSSDPVTVSSDAGSGYAALTVTLRGGTNAAFASSSSRGLTATGGGVEAVVSLTASAIELFTVDGLELSLALTASDADESSTVTLRFVSTPRGFDGAALSELIRTTGLPSGTEVFAALDANLTIWHNNNDDEEYSLEGDGSELFTAGSDGAVRAAGELEVGSGKSYALTLILRDGEASARRRLELELSPPVLSALDGVTATVEWDAGSGTAALSLTLELETGATFAATTANGLETAGGREATILLANDAVNLFTADGLELTLTLAASNGGGTVFLTARFESSSRPFAGGLAEAMLPLSEAIAGVEIFTAEEVGLTIWHNDNEDERYELTQDVELFGVDEGTGRVTASLEVSAGVYEMTLGLTDGETTAERPLRLEVLPPALAIVSSAALSSGRVTVSSDAGSGYAALTVTLRGGTNAAFLSSSAPGLTATGGGVEAVVSLTASAIELFTLDGLELSLALTASDADESSTVTLRFVSTPRGFDGAALSELIGRRRCRRDGGVRGGGCESYDLAQQRRRRGIQFGGRWIGVVYGGIGRRGEIGG